MEGAGHLELEGALLLWLCQVHGLAGVVLLPPWRVLCPVVVVQSELGEPGASSLCFQVRCLAVLRVLYRVVMNGPVIDLCTQSQILIAS